MTPLECAAAAEAILASGGDPLVLDARAELTTTEAAKLLGVSRPTLMLAMERGQIPYAMRGAHRRLRVADVIRYREGR